ncbi:hypothetical protein RB195_022934 [Necator americanus]|uniref:Uncharacterized protein n=1 Tax=Necator americanus TaxID=51031 RepID=A0ABR1EJQ5_NECAM
MQNSCARILNLSYQVKVTFYDTVRNENAPIEPLHNRSYLITGRVRVVCRQRCFHTHQKLIIAKAVRLHQHLYDIFL